MAEVLQLLPWQSMSRETDEILTGEGAKERNKNKMENSKREIIHLSFCFYSNVCLKEKIITGEMI